LIFVTLAGLFCVLVKNRILFSRTVIIGNSGSGKTVLAGKLSEVLYIPITHLDKLFWEPGGFNQKRPKETVYQEVDLLKVKETWIVEGVFGELAQEFLDRANCLIWLDMGWEYCLSNLLQRGSEANSQLDPNQAEINFRALLEWASHYWDRNDLRSFEGHKQLFNCFSGSKYCLQSRDEVSTFIEQGKAGFSPNQTKRSDLEKF
jgi:adenylate kinase family enzyme